MKQKKVVVGMSGGVDSSLTASLLQEQGYVVTGLYMQTFVDDGCGADKERQDALKVALKLEIPFKVVDFTKEYKKRVIDVFYKEYKKGRTPNPDILCNKEIKFGLLLEWVEENGYDFLATGHYAQTERGRLFRSKDIKKDQTYFLSMLKARQLEKVIFPLGEMLKDEVREKAKKRGLHVWNKKDSVGVCMAGGDVDFDEFLRKEIKEHKGEVVNMEGKVIGEHVGVEFYTVGQRHGFRVKNVDNHSGARYVVKKEFEKNKLVVGGKKDLEVREFEVEEWSWIVSRAEEGEALEFRIRHQGKLMRGKIAGRKVKLEKFVEGVASGQVVAVYRNQECLGGGVISY